MDEDKHSASSEDSALRLENAIIAMGKARSSAMENEKRQNELLFSECTNVILSLDSMLPKLERALARRINAVPASPVSDGTVEHNIVTSSNDTDAVEGPNETEEHNTADSHNGSYLASDLNTNLEPLSPTPLRPAPTKPGLSNRPASTPTRRTARIRVSAPPSRPHTSPSHAAIPDPSGCTFMTIPTQHISLHDDDATSSDPYQPGFAPPHTRHKRPRAASPESPPCPQ